MDYCTNLSVSGSKILDVPIGGRVTENIIVPVRVVLLCQLLKHVVLDVVHAAFGCRHYVEFKPRFAVAVGG
jgi:hypothetical protein